MRKLWYLIFLWPLSFAAFFAYGSIYCLRETIPDLAAHDYGGILKGVTASIVCLAISIWTLLLVGREFRRPR